MTPFFLLILLALIFCVLSIAFPRFPLLSVAVLLICVALLLGRS